MKNLAAALVKAQSEMSNPTKGNTNPFFQIEVRGFKRGSRGGYSSIKRKRY